MNIVFFGTPEFAIPSLNALQNSSHKVVAVVTQPTKATGRGKKEKPGAVETYAIQHSIPVYKFRKIRKEGIEDLKKLDADVFVTCAYGQILSEEILTMKKYGVINIHASLLPKLRGSSPIQWTIINGERVTGITILKSDIGIDDGPVILQKETPVKENDTSETLFESLSHMGAECIIEALSLIESGQAKYTVQNHENATVCKFLTKEMATLDFNLSTMQLVNLINGLNVWPVCKVQVDDLNLKLYKARLVSETEYEKLGLILNDEYKNGEVVISSAKLGLIVKANDGFFEILELQAENSKRMTAKSFLNGKKIEKGSLLK